MGQFVDIELDKKLFKNVDEGMLTSTFADLENLFVTEANGLSSFPGLKEFANPETDAVIHINKYQNDMIAVGEDGQTFRVDENANIEQISGPPVLGGDRVSFTRTRGGEGLLMAAGAQIIKYDGIRNSVLSEEAPLSSWVGYIDGYALAVEKNSGRFEHSDLDNFVSWPGLNTFSVDGSPDNINSMLITPFNEILFAGEESIEQYERYVGGDVAFFRRWSIGDGISEPWTLCYADNAAWGLNTRFEFVRLSGQVSQSVSDDIQKDFEDKYNLGNLSSIDGAWAAPCYIKGQKFIVFQSPKATNKYGTEGFTAVFDIRRGQWFEIFGWDSSNGVPSLWPGRSVFQLWGKTFVGGEGKIYELDSGTYQNDGQVQRRFARTAHFDTLGTMHINKVRFTLKRGVGSYNSDTKFFFRTRKDYSQWSKLQIKSLGKKGQQQMIVDFGAQGIAETWQFEFGTTDNSPFELRRLQAEVEPVTR